MKGVRLLSGLLLFLIFVDAKSQQASETFGMNRIQYKSFTWKYLSSENFDVYFYGDRRKLAQEALQYLESEFNRITDLLGFYPYQKTKVFLYNSITDLQQSNVGLNHTRFNVSGETEFIKPYVEIAHPGNLAEFKEELVFKMSDLMVNEMMFGGSLKDMFQSSVLLNLPEWFISGTSYYVAHGWNEEMDDYVRQLVNTKRVNKALRFKGKDAALVGQSIWNYIVEKYGKSSINNILNYTRIIRNEEKSILITLGVSFKQMMNDWKEYYKGMERRTAQSYVMRSDSQRLTYERHRPVTYTTVKVSPDGKSIAYAENDRGKFVVKVKSLENGNESLILQGGNRVIRQTVDYRVPLLSWSDPNTLGVIGVKNGQYVFWLYDLKTKSKVPRELDKFSNIRSFSFSNNGRLVIISADFEGQNDMFLLSSRRDRTKRLTNDAYDDLDPAFIPGTNTIVFSSNRTNDTLATDTKAFQKLSPNYNLFLFNIDTTTNRLIRVTNTLSKDFHARAKDQNTFYYLSDQRGIINIFRHDISTGVYTQVTNFNSSIKDYDLNLDNHILATVMTQNLREDIFVDKNFNLNKQVFTPVTRRKEILQTKMIVEKRKKEPVKPTSIKDLINARLKERTDSAGNPIQNPVDRVNEEKKDSTVVLPKKANGEISTDDYSFDEPPPVINREKKTMQQPPTQPKPKETVDTDDYAFEEEVAKPKSNETFLTRYMKAKEVAKVTGPFGYSPKFSYESLTTDFVVDQLRGFSIRMKVQMNDMLENYRFFGGFQVAWSDFKSGDVFAEFQYLPHRVDFSARLERKVIYWQTHSESANPKLQRYSLQKMEFGASYPISVRTRLSVKPFLGYTEFVDRGPSIPGVGSSTVVPTFNDTQTQFYGGGKVEIVYDNSIASGLNIMEGTRGKLVFNTNQAMGNSKKSFSQLYVDIRHYQKIYKEVVFAVRGYAGTFMGNSPKNYLLGGMDNWIGNNTNYNGLRNPLVNSVDSYNENLLFAEFATGLRGFDYASQYGNSVALANAEFRLPLIRALTNGPIASNFFRNLQLISFFDVGSSWTGEIPFGKANSGVVREVKNGPFDIQIKEYLNPWLYSYGAGFRTMLFGYYMKFDCAWPTINYKVQEPRLQVSLGFDF